MGKNKVEDAKKRIIVFGIDGATWEIIEHMVEKGQLPNFRKIMRKGVYGNLRSVNPPVTCPAWATMFTGKNPATLGVYDFFKPDKDYKLKVSNLNWKKWRPIWDIFSDAGKKVCVFNVPTTTASKVNGYFISGPIWGETDDQLAYPDVLNEELNKNNYLIRTWANQKVNGDKVYIESIKDITEKKFNLFYKYFQKSDWDLFIMGFYYCDQLQHTYWKDFEPKHVNHSPNSKFKNTIPNHYEQLDTFIGKILDNLPENTTLFILSDHGHEPSKSYVNLNAWLLENGFLELKESNNKGQTKEIKKNLNKQLLKTFSLFSKSYSELMFQTRLYNKESFQKIQKRLKNALYVMENKTTTKYPLHELVNWEKTVAYSLIFNTFFINEVGRGSKGCVNEGKYNNVRDEIIQKLKELKDPLTNETVVKHIWTIEELYPNNTPSDFPDIIMQFNRGFRNYYSENFRLTDVFSSDFAGSTEHYLDGIFLAYGPEIVDGKKLHKASLEDIVPTILHQMGFEILNEVDGMVLTEIFKEDSDPAHRDVITVKVDDLKDQEGKKIQKIKFSKKI